MLLDLSAAFDTVDQSIWWTVSGMKDSRVQLLAGLRPSWSTARILFASPTLQRLTVDVQSTSGILTIPHLFNLYLLPLILSLRERNGSTFNYADHLQLIFTDNTANSVSEFQATMLHIHNWMTNNHLKLNPDKTELILTGGARNPWSSHFCPVELGSPPTPSSTAKSLGVTINRDLSMKSQIGKVVSTCFFQLRKIKKISRLLTREALVQAVLALVISHRLR